MNKKYRQNTELKSLFADKVPKKQATLIQFNFSFFATELSFLFLTLEVHVLQNGISVRS